MDNILSLVVMLVVFEGLVIISLIALVVYLMRTKRQDNNNGYKEIYDAGLIQAKAIFEEDLKKLATKYAEELAAYKFFEECDGVDIDLSHISEETQKRVLALSFKKAESAVALCENNLSKVRDAIAHHQKRIAEGYDSSLTKVSAMKNQEKYAIEHLEQTKLHLDHLTKIVQSAT